MKIGVSGASGQLGKAIVEDLKARGAAHEIVAISRTPEIGAVSIEARYGDYDRPDSLVSAYAGLDRLVIIPSHDTRPGVRDRHFIAAIDAATRANIRHSVLISSCATRDWPKQSMYAPYFVGEQHLFRTAPRWTVLRMNYYAETLAQMAPMLLPSGTLAGLGDGRIGYVSRDDLGAAAAGILLGDSDSDAGAIYNATGPETLSGPERAALLSETMGKPMRFIKLDEPQLRAGMIRSGMPPEYIDAMVDIERSYVAGSFDIVTGDVERLAGRPAKSLRDVLLTMRAPLQTSP
ncbi:NAD(P)H dehydrogenase (quinone) [Sphingomonas leidyi]|uniref:NAD(P)H dehydrogenase (Quinone) n=1 Tax=Sphingomonas leidyi TaxID=68569 RepID=A0A7X5UX64_9SPHN|nr:SDR family oxidoreductase [Sphingomonas leidyi]NIJ63939.1 NAD(P)H dehydrogenase (quinone) [Sphingomonas leidyi]